jgi:hypothetical protein
MMILVFSFCIVGMLKVLQTFRRYMLFSYSGSTYFYCASGLAKVQLSYVSAAIVPVPREHRPCLWRAGRWHANSYNRILRKRADLKEREKFGNLFHNFRLGNFRVGTEKKEKFTRPTHFGPEDGGCMYIRNVAKYIHTAQSPETDSVLLSFWLSYLSTYGSTVILLDLGRVFSFLILYTVGRIPWTGDLPVLRLLPIHRTTQAQNKRIQTYIPRMGFEPTVPGVRASEGSSCLKPRGHLISVALIRYTELADSQALPGYIVDSRRELSWSCL